MTPIPTLIVDDEPLARERLRTLLAPYNELTIVGECRDGHEAVAAIRKLKPLLVFLDVQMPEMDGFGVIKAVGPDNMPTVVFATAYDQHALRAFEVHALDYLLKPFDLDRFEEAVRRVIKQVKQQEAAPLPHQLADLLQTLRPPQWLERVMIKTRARIYFLRLDEVDWIEAARNYVQFHTGGRTHLLRQTLSGLEEQLNPNQFLRIHRSTIVNLDRIKELQPLFNGEYQVVLHDGTRLTLSRSYHKQLQDVFQG